MPKAKTLRSKKIKDSARGMQCTLNVSGICNYNTETTVYCHLPDESHGMALKASDLCGCYGCSSCHDVMDGRVHSDEFRQHKDFYLRRAHVRTLNSLVDLGLLKVA